MKPNLGLNAYPKFTPITDIMKAIKAHEDLEKSYEQKQADVAALVRALTKATVSIQLSAFTQDHLAKQAAERRAFDEADGHRHTAALLSDELTELRAVLARHAGK